MQLAERLNTEAITRPVAAPTTAPITVPNTVSRMRASRGGASGPWVREAADHEMDAVDGRSSGRAT